jgi:protoporphyrinogen oxidase
MSAAAEKILAGYQGIGIPDCIRMGRAAAEKILNLPIL